jgi:hypothetical protein
VKFKWWHDGTDTYFTALTPTLSRKEREPDWSDLPFPRPLGEGPRVREFVLRFWSLESFETVSDARPTKEEIASGLCSQRPLIMPDRKGTYD